MYYPIDGISGMSILTVRAVTVQNEVDWRYSSDRYDTSGILFLKSIVNYQNTWDMGSP